MTDPTNREQETSASTIRSTHGAEPDRRAYDVLDPVARKFAHFLASQLSEVDRGPHDPSGATLQWFASKMLQMAPPDEVRRFFRRSESEDEVRRINWAQHRDSVALQRALEEGKTRFVTRKSEEAAGQSALSTALDAQSAAQAAREAADLDDRLDAIMQLKQTLGRLVKEADDQGARQLGHAAVMIKWAVGLEYAENMSRTQLEGIAEATQLLNDTEPRLSEVASCLRRHDLDYIPYSEVGGDIGSEL